MKPFRSLLFVPGHKADWVDKGVRSGADALILDLEDAVPESDKSLAREVTGHSIERLHADSGVGVVVRVNALDTEHFGRDLASVVRPGLTALLLPKIFDRRDVIAFDALVRHFEIEAGMAARSVSFIPSLETAKSLTNIDRIANSPRVACLMAAAAKDADISREVGFRWTPGGQETLYLRSRAVLAARSAGLRQVVLGLWQDIKDLDGLRSFALQNAGLGFTGQVVIHPSHVPIVNDAYSLSTAERDRLFGLIEAYETGAAVGEGAVMYQGEHIDRAHYEHARQLLDMSRESGV